MSYSGTPQARKLGLKAGQRVAFDEPPPGWQLREPPDGLLVPEADGAADLIIAFFWAEIELADRLPALARRIFPAGALPAGAPVQHDVDPRRLDQGTPARAVAGAVVPGRAARGPGSPGEGDGPDRG